MAAAPANKIANPAMPACGTPPAADIAKKLVFPLAVQAFFDHAQALERGRKGASLSRFVPPRLEAADAAYAAAFAALAAARPPAPPAGWARVFGKYAAAAARVRAARRPRGPPPRLDERRRSALAIRYDASRHDLAAAVRGVFGVEAGFPLEAAHERWTTPAAGDPPPACPALLCALARCRKLPRRWRALAARRREHIRAFRATAAYGAFVAAFRAFVADVVVPVVGEGVAYQCPPTLRLHFPGPRALGAPHRDGDYDGHTGDEINFWVPLTRAAGTSSLYVESAPGADDAAPLDLRYGDCYRFDGEHCKHHTVANATGATRVSLDFRCIPLSLYEDRFGGRIGSYPAETTAAACGGRGQ